MPDDSIADSCDVCDQTTVYSKRGNWHIWTCPERPSHGRWAQHIDESYPPKWKEGEEG